MPRPKCCRQVTEAPRCALFKPTGAHAGCTEEVVLTVDEFEAIRLADLECMYQEEAAGCMRVSRQTFGRIVKSGREKVARALIEGKSLRIEGGRVEMTSGNRSFACSSCQCEWEEPQDAGRPEKCPQCESTSLHRCRGHHATASSGGGCGCGCGDDGGHGHAHQAKACCCSS